MQPASSQHSAHTHYTPSAGIYYSGLFLLGREGEKKQVNQAEKWTKDEEMSKEKKGCRKESREE